MLHQILSTATCRFAVISLCLLGFAQTAKAQVEPWKEIPVGGGDFCMGTVGKAVVCRNGTADINIQLSGGGDLVEFVIEPLPSLEGGSDNGPVWEASTSSSLWLGCDSSYDGDYGIAANGCERGCYKITANGSTEWADRIMVIEVTGGTFRIESDQRSERESKSSGNNAPAYNQWKFKPVAQGNHVGSGFNMEHLDSGRLFKSNAMEISFEVGPQCADSYVDWDIKRTKDRTIWTNGGNPSSEQGSDDASNDDEDLAPDWVGSGPRDQGTIYSMDVPGLQLDPTWNGAERRYRGHFDEYVKVITNPMTGEGMSCGPTVEWESHLTVKHDAGSNPPRFQVEWESSTTDLSDGHDIPLTYDGN